MAAKRTLQIILVLAVLAACLAVPRPAAAAGPCGSTYIVQRGDWLVKIAARCGVTLSALYSANPGLIYQRYIYPGQVLNIPSGQVVPPYYPPQPQPPSVFYYPNMVAIPHVGGNYYSSRSSVGVQRAFQVTVKNNGNTALQVVATLAVPDGWDLDNHYSDCPDLLGAGSLCTFTWLFTPRVTGYAYVRAYLRGYYTDASGYQGRVTASPAFLFVVDP
jgi:LysM repeat protein